MWQWRLQWNIARKNVVREFDEDTYGSIDASMYSPAVRNEAARERLADRSIWWTFHLAENLLTGGEKTTADCFRCRAQAVL